MKFAKVLWPLITFTLCFLFTDTSFAQIRDSVQIDSLFKEYKKVENLPDSALKLYFDFFSNKKYQDKFPYFVSRAYRITGLLKSDKGAFKEAILYYDSAKVFAEKANDRKGIAAAYNNTGMSYQLLGYQDLCIQNYLKALQIAESIQDTNYIIIFQSNVASLYFAMRQYENALKYSKRSLAIALVTKDVAKAGLARVYVDIALVYFELKQTDTAVYYNNLAKVTALKTDDSPTIANTFLMDYRLMKSSNFPAALASLKKGTELTEEIQKAAGGAYIHKLVEAYQFNGEAAQLKNEFDSAKFYFDKCLNLGKESGSLELTKAAYEALRNMSEQKKDYYNAFMYANLYKQYSDSLYTMDKEKTVQQNAIVFETEKKEAELELSSLKINEQKKEISRKNAQMLGTAAFILLLVGGSYFMFNNFKLKKKVEQQQALISERKRIGTELHDDLGAQLSTARILMGNLKMQAATVADAALIENSINVLEGSIQQLRNIMNDLQNTTLEQKGFIAAAEELVNTIAPFKAIKFILLHTGMEQRLNKNTEHHLFRILQELINNTLKYAHAKTISLDIVNSNDQLTLMYEDDGSGFDSKNILRGNGLNNIEQRVHALGGTAEIDSAVKKGMRLSIHIPKTSIA